MLTWNTGISYGLFPQEGPLGQWALLALKAVAAILLWIWLARASSRLTAVAGAHNRRGGRQRHRPPGLRGRGRFRLLHVETAALAVSTGTSLISPMWPSSPGWSDSCYEPRGGQRRKSALIPGKMGSAKPHLGPSRQGDRYAQPIFTTGGVCRPVGMLTLAAASRRHGRSMRAADDDEDVLLDTNVSWIMKGFGFAGRRGEASISGAAAAGLPPVSNLPPPEEPRPPSNPAGRTIRISRVARSRRRKRQSSGVPIA